RVPPGVTDAVTQSDGRTVYVPPAFLTRGRRPRVRDLDRCDRRGADGGEPCGVLRSGATRLPLQVSSRGQAPHGFPCT
ncbi:hypothetical protein ACISU4_23065, partial [Streptomyces wuyuanensis]|uniref:hypothetical protein n=1 Tax=Streptomyces wuyuanensis TaxID=1196353 RepID=UPI0037FCDE12